MHEGDLRTTGSDLRVLVDKPRLACLELLKLAAYVCYLEAYVVQSLTTLPQEFANRGIWAERLKKFYVGITGIELGNTHALLFDGFDAEAFQPKSVLIKLQRLF